MVRAKQLQITDQPSKPLQLYFILKSFSMTPSIYECAKVLNIIKSYTVIIFWPERVKTSALCCTVEQQEC